MTYQPPPGPGYAAPPYTPRAVRPPLTARAKRGAALGGAIGFPLLTLGYALVAIPVALAVIIAFFALIVRTASGSASSPNAGFEQFISGIDLTRWIVPIVVSALVGIVLMIASIMLSGRVLRAHDVRRPWAVTWAGAGIAVVGTSVVSSILSSFSGVVFGGLSGTSHSGDSGSLPSFEPGIIVALIVGVVVALAVNAVIGWLSWWWMAHAMRPATVVAPGPGSPPPVPGA